jgi:hypothetical protein
LTLIFRLQPGQMKPIMKIPHLGRDARKQIDYPREETGVKRIAPQEIMPLVGAVGASELTPTNRSK